MPIPPQDTRARGDSWLFARALLSFLALPGAFALVLPSMVQGADPWRGTGWPVGGIVLVLGLLVVLWCVRDFYVSGRGTLAPWDPPKHLVIVGLYRFTRNPMYLGVLTLVAGWSLLAGSPLVAAYAVAGAIGFHLRVVYFEEPWLAKTFTAEWSRYAGAVRRWLPRLEPWRDSP